MLTPILAVLVPLALVACYLVACRLAAPPLVVDRDAHRRAQAEWLEHRSEGVNR